MVSLPYDNNITTLWDNIRPQNDTNIVAKDRVVAQIQGDNTSACSCNKEGN